MGGGMLPECFSSAVGIFIQQVSSVLAEDQVLFYMVFECMLVTIYCTITSSWYTARACYALGMLVVYTIIGSSCMATAMVIQYCIHGAAYSYHGIEATCTYC